MTEGERWWQESTGWLRRDPEYLAEGLSLEVATRVNEAMLRASLTQKQLAGRLRVSQPYVSQVLAGKTNLTLLSICKLAVSLDVPIADLLGVESTSNRPELRGAAEDADSVLMLAELGSTALTCPEPTKGRYRDSRQPTPLHHNPCLNSTAGGCSEHLMTA